MKPSLRPLLTGALVLALASVAGGCSWFKSKSNYEASRESQPLEVPPDLNLPDTSNSIALPTTASGQGRVGSREALIPGQSAADLYPKVGSALESIAGVAVNGRSESTHSYEVAYGGESFLVQVQDSQGGGSRLIALTADGRLLTSGAGADLLRLVRAKL